MKESPIKLIMAVAAGAAVMFFLLLVAVIGPTSQIPAIVQTANEMDTVPIELRGILETEATAAGVTWYNLAAYVAVVYHWNLPIPSMDEIGLNVHDADQAVTIWRANAAAWIRAQLVGGDVLARVPEAKWREFRNLRDALRMVDEIRKGDKKGWTEASSGESYELVLAMRDWFHYTCPVPGATFSNDWGNDRPQNAGYASTRHQGTDLFAPRGTPIKSVNVGVVYSMGWNRLGGRTVTVQDTSGALIYYAHMQGYGDVVRGSQVWPGTVVGYVGTSGEGPDPTDDVIGQPHLHLGIYLESGATNPFPYVSRWCGNS